MLTVKDDEDMFDTMFAFMEKSIDEEADEEGSGRAFGPQLKRICLPCWRKN